MDALFDIHNLQLESVKAFQDNDPQLRTLKKQTLIHRDRILDEFPQKIPGIYALTGGRQIGKSTLMKQWMLELMNSGTNPNAIYYLTGEYIEDHHKLLHIINRVFADMPKQQLHFLIIDEVTYIKDWDKCIKFLADAGRFDNTVVMLTGSDTMMLQTAIKRFPGRRGKAQKVNFHMYPLSFKETITLKNNIALPDKISVDPINLSEKEINLLYTEFDEYLIHGGFLTAINDFATHHSILDATLATYSEWISGDMLRAGKNERYLREISRAIIKH